ncbi:Adenine deaminase [groundwater metagenome]|uniref:adenine deaminase n=1 Tax=groundwater metagenome TaxID=717931 RepID=A0A098EBL9_9ZZZZ
MDKYSILINSALHPEKCDLFVEGNLVNVITKEIYKSRVGITNGKIVYLEKDENIKSNKFLLPSFIDSHIHIESSMLIPSEFAKLAVKHGTCAVVADPHEIANVLGVEGIKFMIENSKNELMYFYFNIPSCVPAAEGFETSEKITINDIKKLKKYKRILGLAEVMNFPGVLNCNPEIIEKIKIFNSNNFVIDGHCPNLKGNLLNAYALFVHSDHESTEYSEAIEKLRKGMYLMLREGSAAKNINILREIVKNKISPAHCMLVCDDIHADELNKGHINLLLKRAVEMGMNEIDAIRLATLNPANYFNLKNLGALAIGKDANITIVDNLKDFNIEKVIFKGKVVVSDGKILVKFKKRKISEKFTHTVKIRKINPWDLKIRTDRKEGRKKVRVIKAIDGQIFTKENIMEVEVKDYCLMENLNKDILKIVVVDRHKGENFAVGFVHGLGIKKGAIASSISHDAHNIICVGSSDEYILKAINEIQRIEGGIAVVSNNEIYFVQLNVAGLMSDNGKDVIEKTKILNEKAKDLGCTLTQPFMTLSFLALPVIPELKITDKGLVNTNEFKFTDLIVK